MALVNLQKGLAQPNHLQCKHDLSQAHAVGVAIITTRIDAFDMPLPLKENPSNSIVLHPSLLQRRGHNVSDPCSRLMKPRLMRRTDVASVKCFNLSQPSFLCFERGAKRI